MHLSQDQGSYRDPSGNIYIYESRIFRTVTKVGIANYEAIRGAKLLDVLQQKNYIVATRELKEDEKKSLHSDFTKFPYVLEHEKIPYISYPYEWSFEQLKAATLHHLDLQLFCFNHKFVLSDSTAYNIQFIGHRPIFIDILSFKPYKAGEFWQGYRQFCEQFLYPLLLQSQLGVDYNNLYKGSLEGITATDLNAMLPFYKKLSLQILMHLVMPARLEQMRVNNPDKILQDAQKKRQLSPNSYRGFLISFINWVKKLSLKNSQKKFWSRYEVQQTYNNIELNKKRRFIEKFIKQTKPKILFDLGCNIGSYSLLSRESGAQYVVGFDSDSNSIDIAYERSKAISNFLPLIVDASNMSPNHGWMQNERKGFIERAHADALIALAFEHHLIISKNIPMQSFLQWLLSIADEGIVEFVPKEDQTVQRMLATREDIFKNYTQENFENILVKTTSIFEKEIVSESGRTLYWYKNSHLKGAGQ